MVPLLSVEDCKWYEMMMESGRHLAEERSPNLSSKRQSLQDRRRVTAFKVVLPPAVNASWTSNAWNSPCWWCATAMLHFPSWVWCTHNILCGRCALRQESKLIAFDHLARVIAFTAVGGLDDESWDYQHVYIIDAALANVWSADRIIDTLILVFPGWQHDTECPKESKTIKPTVDGPNLERRTSLIP